MDSHCEGDMTKHMTYKELSGRLDIKIESVRRLVMRKKWKRVKGNDGETRIHVPDDFLDGRDDKHNDDHDDKNDNVTMTLRVENEALKMILDAERKRADAAEKDRDRWHELATKSWWKKIFSAN